jgi:aminopeptidase YwaD
LFEDGDLLIPNAYMTSEEGLRLRAIAPPQIALTITSQRLAAQASNVIACSQLATEGSKRHIFTAHIDSKPGTPGALDNASGIVVLLLLSEIIQESPVQPGVEIIAFNGEDYYSAAGQVDYLNSVDGIMIELVTNLDGVGSKDSGTSFSFYNFAPEKETRVRASLERFGLCQGESWYQGDHMIFVQQGIPAIALTSSNITCLMNEIVHSPQDTIDKLDPSELVQVAMALHHWLSEV